MLRVERTITPEDSLKDLSLVEDPKNTRASMLYSVLPAMVSSRLPTIPSLRRSLSNKHAKSRSLTDLSAPGTPPPGYSSRPVSGTTTPNHLYCEAEYEFSDAASERPGSSASALPPQFSAFEGKTGINWKYASQGTNLMTQAYRESSSPLNEIDETTPVLTRQLYIHGMTYLLRGLPTDLTAEETLSLQAALPPSIALSQAEANMHALVPLSHNTSITRGGPRPEPTFLHRMTAMLVFQTFILLQFLLPYIKLFLSHTYQFERKHQITKRFVNTSVTTVDELGRRSLKLSQTICQMNDGKVGQAINEVTLWWVRSVTGGVQQGLEEGLSTLRAASEAPPRRGTVEKVEKDG